MGLAKDESGLFAALVMVHETEQIAKDNVRLLQERLASGRSLMTGRPWNEVLFPKVEASQQGRVVLAKLSLARPLTNWLAWYNNRDPLLLYR